MTQVRIIDSRAWATPGNGGIVQARLIVWETADKTRTGHVIIDKPNPSDADIRAAIDRELTSTLTGKVL